MMKVFGWVICSLICVPAFAAIGPTPNSVSAATATAQNNHLCGAPIKPYYWEIGDQSGPLASGSLGTDRSSGPVLASTKVSLASASKWVYGTYVTQLRGSVGNLTAQDINFLHFTSGYTNMPDSSATCPATLNPYTIDQCLTLTNSTGVPYTALNKAAVGKFDYNGAHMEIHASRYTDLGRTVSWSLGSPVDALLGSNVGISYAEPLVSGGATSTGSDYALMLRHILDGSLAMHAALGTSAVCTHHDRNSTCNAVFSPIPEAWHYSIGHWVEDDPSTGGDGAFSSPGDYGFYPWIDSTKKYYGIISRSSPPAGDGSQHGYASAQCGRLIRHAWMTGVEQTGSLPSAQ